MNSINIHPKVSIVVTCYNQACFLEQAFGSIMNQTYKDFEIIVVDDGSQDNSLEIIKKIAQQNPYKIKICFHENHQNKGIFKSHALGVSLSKGRYVAFLEADDWWANNYLERKVEILNKYQDVGVVFSPYKIISEGGYGYDMMLRQWLIQRFLLKDKPIFNFANLITRNNVATFSAFVVRKSLFLNIKPPYDSRIAFYDWWVLVFFSIQTKFYYDSQSNIYWRHHRSSMLGRQSFSLHKERKIKFLKTLYASIDPETIRLNDQDRESYFNKKMVLPFFLNCYQKPNIKDFIIFLRLDPFWAVESLASYVINYLKYH